MKHRKLFTTVTALGAAALMAATAVPAVSAATAANYIGAAKAKAIALKDAKVAAKNAKFVTVKLETENGVKVYDVEFYAGRTEYDYEINAKTGKIVEKDRDIEGFKIPATNKVKINLAKAKTIALKNAKVAAKNAKFTKAKLTTEDGIKVYDIEFRAGNKKYEYEIHATTGKILEKEVETVKTKKTTAKKTTAITMAQAKKLALARVKGATAKNIKIEADYENGQKIYEGEIKYKGMEYEFEISAKTGKFLEWNVERDD